MEKRSATARTKVVLTDCLGLVRDKRAVGRPDGTDAKRLTHAPGNDAHMGWSPDGEFIVFASTRMGYKDEISYTDSPQPYGEISTMRRDGSDVVQLTDNQWEEGTPAWLSQ